MDTERLIESVRKYPILYDLSHKDYKNITLKSIVWNSIAKELNQNSDTIKNKWKCTRDFYIKYKKAVKGSTGSGRVQSRYLWSSHLSFLDDHIATRPTVSNVQSTHTNHETAIRDANQSHSAPLNPLSSILPPSPLDIIPIEFLEPSTSNCKKRKENDIDKIIHFLNTKKRKDLDGVDHLFLSYAETFKKFPALQQATLKLQLAKLFSDTELDLLQNCTDPPPQQPYHSSAYTIAQVNVPTLRENNSFNQSSNANNPKSPEDNSNDSLDIFNFLHSP